MSNPLEQQFLQLLQNNQDKIFRLCKAYLYNQNQAEDLYQEVLINIWKSLPRFKGKSAISTWAFRISVNTAISYNRKEKKQSLFTPEMPSQLSAPMDQEIEAQQDLKDQMELLHRAIAQLKAQERLIIGLYLEDVSYKEIANIIGATTNLVGVKINRIKTKLSKLLKPVA